MFARWLAPAVCLLILAPPNHGGTRYLGTVPSDGHGPAARPPEISPFIWEQIHKERRMDPPAPPEVLARRAEAAGGPVIFGGFTSVQANVTAGGNDILGDAANEPSIAIDHNNPDRMAIGWRQFDSIASNFRQAGYAYSTDGGDTWTFPGVIEPGIFRSDPVLAADAFGNFYYSSLGHHPVTDDFEIYVFKSTDGGATWPIKTYAFGGDKQWMVADQRASGLGAGNLYQSWVHFFTCCGDADFTRSGDGGLSFTSAVAMPDPRSIHGTLATGPDGTLYIAGREGMTGVGHTFGRIQAADVEAPIVFDPLIAIDLGGDTVQGGGPNPGGLLGQVWIAAHPSEFGKLYVLGSVNPPGPDPLDIMFISSTDNGANWTAPQRVNDDAAGSNAWQWFGTMSVAPNGRIDAVWADTRVSGATNQSAVFYSFSTDGGATWSPNEQVSPVFDSFIGWPNQNKIGDYYHMISDDLGASLAYSATFTGGQDVYYVRIAADCNNNGVDDECDVDCGDPGSICDVPMCGLSADCNNNDLPDECESGPDCNDNNIPDECDIAGGASLDRDTDTVPDECEGACCHCSCDTLPLEQCADGNFGGLGTICVDPGACEITDPSCSDRLYWASKTPGSIMRAAFDGSQVEEVIPGLSGQPQDVAVELSAGKIYWSEAVGDRIARANLDGSAVETFIPAVDPAGLALDVGAGVLYWTMNGASDGIFRINLDGTGEEALLSETNVQMGTVVLHPATGRMYWSVNECSPCTFGRIRRANLDGTDVTTLVALDVAVTGLDVSQDSIYWSERANQAVFRADLDGAGIQQLGFSLGRPSDLALALQRSELYWADSILNRLGRSSLDVSDPAVFIPSTSAPGGISFLHFDCDGNQIADACDLDCGPLGGVCDVPGCGAGPDCNANGIHDACELLGLDHADCNQNGIFDSCDIHSGASLDLDGNGVPDECTPGSPLPEPADGGKNRFVSFTLPPAAQATAIRVRLDTLHDTTSPPNAPDFSAFEGQYRYVNTFRDAQNQPVLDCADSASLSSFYKCASLGCQPEYRNWAADLAGEVLHVSGSAVVPSSTLAISQLDASCQGSESGCLLASAELPVTTRRWGNVVDSGGANPVNAVDIAAVVDKAKDLASAVSEPQGLLQPQVPNPMGSAVGAQDIARAVDAVKGAAYPFTIDACP